MKLSSSLRKLKQEKVSQQGISKPRGPMLTTSTWVLLGLTFVLAGFGTWAVFDFIVWNKVPPELVGLWEVEQGPQKGATFEFFRDGVMEVQMRRNKKEISHKAQVAVRDKTLLMTSKNPLTRK